RFTYRQVSSRMSRATAATSAASYHPSSHNVSRRGSAEGRRDPRPHGVPGPPRPSRPALEPGDGRRGRGHGPDRSASLQPAGGDEAGELDGPGAAAADRRGPRRGDPYHGQGQPAGGDGDPGARDPAPGRAPVAADPARGAVAR